ncbi:2-oxo-4-hydroxy-4-carboxy-5-ureidoimidazoline decarboxylase [Nymphon striatum]|nr:2-oxo-4-hydroxy-4-carboxy-5-ureidoimidazoline decarboxylase [Nymphon striatum]
MYRNQVMCMTVMVRAFRDASKEARMKVLLAHPDLAGKLAQAKQLTEASTSEQASAGLDMLTDDEREMFTRQNNAYVEKFGFPFIIAVKDNTKASIVSAFEARLGNTQDQEFEEACKQVERIAYHRLADMLD